MSRAQIPLARPFRLPRRHGQVRIAADLRWLPRTTATARAIRLPRADEVYVYLTADGYRGLARAEKPAERCADALLALPADELRAALVRLIARREAA